MNEIQSECPEAHVAGAAVNTQAYREAVNNIGPEGFLTLRYQWNDKPRRLVESLCDEIDRLNRRLNPPPNFDHDPRFDEGGELHEEANGDDEQMPESIQHDGSIAVAANLQPNIPKALMRPTLLQARRIVARVQDSLCSPGFDKNDATGLLAQVVAMLDTILEGNQSK